MAGGGTAEAMKISDVFIVVGISILVGGFIMHAWVSSEQYNFQETEEEIIEKSFVLFKNDEVEIEISAPQEHSVFVGIYSEDETLRLEPDMESSGFVDGSVLVYTLSAKSSGEYLVFIQFDGKNGNKSNSSGEILIDVERSLLIDFIVYPIGAISLAFGIHKRKEEKSTETIDAEID